MSVSNKTKQYKKLWSLLYSLTHPLAKKEKQDIYVRKLLLLSITTTPGGYWLNFDICLIPKKRRKEENKLDFIPHISFIVV